MIGRIWEELFHYADDLKAREEWEKYAAVQEIEDRLLEIWDDAERFKTRIEKEPQNKLEEIVLSIPGLEVFRDPRDKNIFYEMDGRHFDRPEEVIRALIRYRSAGRKKAMTQTKIEMYKYIHAHLKKMALEDLNEEKNREITEKTKARKNPEESEEEK